MPLCSLTFRTLHLWSRLSARLPPSPLRFTLGIDTPPLSCFTERGGGLSPPPARTITRNLLSLVPFDSFQMCHILTFSLLHIYSLSFFHLFQCIFSMFHLGPSVCLMMDILVWRLTIIIGHPVIPSTSHLSCEQCLNCFCIKFKRTTHFQLSLSHCQKYKVWLVESLLSIVYTMCLIDGVCHGSGHRNKKVTFLWLTRLIWNKLHMCKFECSCVCVCV